MISGFGFSLGNSYQFLIKNSIADEGLFGMQVLIEVFSDDWVAINTNANLLQESINVRVKPSLATLLHNYQSVASTFYEVPNVLQLVTSERLTRAS